MDWAPNHHLKAHKLICDSILADYGFKPYQRPKLWPWTAVYSLSLTMEYAKESIFLASAELLANIKPSDLPAPPQAALKMLRACSAPDVSNQELSRLAGHDAAISAELLRVANSAYFAQQKPVQSVSTAVSVLGMRTLRNLVLCHSVQDVLKQDAIPGFDIGMYWEESLRRAISARMLGKAVGLDPEECFTAGLLQDLGFPVSFFINSKLQNGSWEDFKDKDPDQRLQHEKDTFGTTHDQVVGLLASTWELPENLSQALACHHQCSQASEKSIILCKVLHGADWMAAIFSANDKAATHKRCQELLQSSFSFDLDDVTNLLDAIPDAVEEEAKSLGLRIAEQIDFDEIMRTANARLAEENLSYQELTWQLQQTLRERDQLAEELNRELTLAREIQKRLMPEQPDTDFPVRGINISARELSGDFFDYFTLPDGRIYFALGDVSGKGTNAALLMTKTASLFRCLGKDIDNPSTLVKRINEEILETVTRGMFVTMIVGIFYPKENRVKLVNAGHPPAILIVPGQKPKSCIAQAPPLGISKHENFPANEMSLNSGCLYLFSDGVIEARLEDGSEMGLGGLLQLLLDNSQTSSKDRLQSIVETLSHSGDQKDDITMLMIERAHGC